MLEHRVAEWTGEWKQQGWIEGIESEKKLLIRMIQRRFGHVISEIAKTILNSVMDTDTLEQIGDWIIDCNEGEILLNNNLKAL